MQAIMAGVSAVLWGLVAATPILAADGTVSCDSPEDCSQQCEAQEASLNQGDSQQSWICNMMEGTGVEVLENVDPSGQGGTVTLSSTSYTCYCTGFPKTRPDRGDRKPKPPIELLPLPRPPPVATNPYQRCLRDARERNAAGMASCRATHGQGDGRVTRIKLDACLARVDYEYCRAQDECWGRYGRRDRLPRPLCELLSVYPDWIKKELDRKLR